ncbi:hypothetical protein T265_04573 [Opisthorchis viverrini]|uniref:Uncharacterized protein n=1 Tax=Opisthorchis viverrini TaxID=6198 RepID=A0A075AGD2_OPIVI|nr:hypothetical protein T265_04573 [Opisthorchis viverrini]KER28619.1 hypothetical protein T265_04573 [Opisthorchis viverrini]
MPSALLGSDPLDVHTTPNNLDSSAAQFDKQSAPVKCTPMSELEKPRLQKDLKLSNKTVKVYIGLRDSSSDGKRRAPAAVVYLPQDVSAHYQLSKQPEPFGHLVSPSHMSTFPTQTDHVATQGVSQLVQSTSNNTSSDVNPYWKVPSATLRGAGRPLVKGRNKQDLRSRSRAKPELLGAQMRIPHGRQYNINR